MERVSGRECARRLGNITEAGLRDAVKQGRIVKGYVREGKRGYYVPDIVARELAENTHPGVGSKGHGGASAGGDRFSSAYAQSRAVISSFQARLAQLEYEERIGKVVSAEQVKRDWFTMTRAIRDNFLNLPDRLASIVAAESDASRCHSMIDEEVKRILNDLARLSY